MQTVRHVQPHGGQRQQRQSACGRSRGPSAPLLLGLGGDAGTAEAGFSYTPATKLLYGLDVIIDMLLEEGLTEVFARHDRHAEATRRAVQHWGLEVLATDPAEQSSVLTAVLLPDGHDADRFRDIALDRFDVSFGLADVPIKGGGVETAMAYLANG